jgi:uncharacterized paraquat-inducible protein A
MPIKVACPGCSKAINAPEAMAGRTGKCPACGAAIDAPTAEALQSSALRGS